MTGEAGRAAAQTTRRGDQALRDDALRDEALGDDAMQAIARALADPRRYAMLRELAAASEPMPCCMLAAARGVSAATMSHHMKELEAAGLVGVERRGRFALLAYRKAVMKAYVQGLASL